MTQGIMDVPATRLRVGDVIDLDGVNHVMSQHDVDLTRYMRDGVTFTVVKFAAATDADFVGL